MWDIFKSFFFMSKNTARMDLLPREESQECVVKSRAVSVEKPGREAKLSIG